MTPKAFRKNRKTLNLTQKALAKELEVSERFIQYIEAGERTPSPLLIRYFEVLIERKGEAK